MKNVTRAVHQSVAESVHRICPQGMCCTIEHQETFKQIKDVSLHCEFLTHSKRVQGAFEQGFSHMKQAQKVAVAGQTICKHSQWTFTTIRQNVSRLCKKLTAQKRTETIRVFFIPHVSHVRCEPHCIVSIDVFDLTWEGCQDCFHQQTFKTEFHDLTPLSSGLPYRTAFTIPHDVSAGSHTNAVGNQFRHFMFRTKSIMLHETSGSKQMTSSMGDIVLNQGAAQSWFG